MFPIVLGDTGSRTRVNSAISRAGWASFFHPAPKEGGEMRREAPLLLATMAAMLLAATGVALALTINGTEGNDVLNGGSAADTIKGLGGSDAIFGKGGNDILEGGDGNDNQKTSLYDNVSKTYVGAGVRGASGDDTIDGGKGDDDIEGNAGRDTVKDPAPNDTDRAWGGPDDDTLDIFDGDARDQAACHDGNDTATIDVLRDANGNRAADQVAANCEKVVRKVTEVTTLP